MIRRYLLFASVSFAAAFFSAVFFAASLAFACASCGSGGDDPLVLFPAETLKVYAGVAMTPSLRSTGPAGEALNSAGPERRSNTIAAAGLALSARAFVTMSGGVTTNARGDASQSGATDPGIAARYTLVMPRLDRPHVPQVQLLAGYRPALVRSIHDSSDPNLLDVFGSGFDEWRAGIDLWSGMLPVKPGLAFSVTQPVAARHNGVWLKPGVLARTTFSLTSMLLAPNFGIGSRQVKLAAGFVADRRQPSSQDGEAVPDSAQSVDGIFASTDVPATESGTVKLVMSRQGITNQTRNAVISTTWTMAWSEVLR